MGAAVGLLARVRACVALQVNELCRGVGADGATVGLLAVVDPHVALQVVGVVRGEGAQRAGVEFRGELTGTSGLAHASPLPVRAVADGPFTPLRVVRLRGADGGFMLQALLTGETIKLHPQVQAHTCSTRDRRTEMVSGRSRRWTEAQTRHISGSYRGLSPSPEACLPAADRSPCRRGGRGRWRPSGPSGRLQRSERRPSYLRKNATNIPVWQREGRNLRQTQKQQTQKHFLSVLSKLKAQQEAQNHFSQQ